MYIYIYACICTYIYMYTYGQITSKTEIECQMSEGPLWWEHRYQCNLTWKSMWVTLSKISVMQCVAVCCNVLQCVAVCCSVLQPNVLRAWMMRTFDILISYQIESRPFVLYLNHKCRALTPKSHKYFGAHIHLWGHSPQNHKCICEIKNASKSQIHLWNHKYSPMNSSGTHPFPS